MMFIHAHPSELYIYYSKFSMAMRHTNILIQIDGELTNACSIVHFSTHIDVINLRQHHEKHFKNGSNYFRCCLVSLCTVACEIYTAY